MALILRSNVLTCDHVKAGLHRGCGGEGGVAGRDLPALLLALASEDVTAALGCDLNIVAASVRVSNLLLLAGADPSCSTRGSTPGTSLLGAHCRLGNTEMVALLLEWAPVWTPAQVGPLTTGQGGDCDQCVQETPRWWPRLGRNTGTRWPRC